MINRNKELDCHFWNLTNIFVGRYTFFDDYKLNNDLDIQLLLRKILLECVH